MAFQAMLAKRTDVGRARSPKKGSVEKRMAWESTARRRWSGSSPASRRVQKVASWKKE
jgi:hypothetical protein